MAEHRLGADHIRGAALARLGYEYLGACGIPGRAYFRKLEPHQFNLHVVQRESSLWDHNLLFRDYLLPFEITSVLVLIGIMGAVVLAKRDDAKPTDRAPEITAEAPRPESQAPAERIHA